MGGRQAHMDDSEQREIARTEREAEIADIVRAALDDVVAVWPAGAPKLKEYFPSVSAYEALPHISIWYFFLMDADIEIAKATRVTAWADRETRRQLLAHGLSQDVAEEAGIIFVTDEDARRAESAYHFFNGCGNWYSEPKPHKGQTF
jgi:hypothetical protein